MSAITPVAILLATVAQLFGSSVDDWTAHVSNGPSHFTAHVDQLTLGENSIVWGEGSSGSATATGGPPSCGTGPVSDACVPEVHCQADGDRGQLVPVSQGIVGPFAPCEIAEPVEASSPEVTPGLVLRALRRIELPAARIVVQPPGGRTLVNFDTLFHTTAEPFTRTVRLLGRRVELAIEPASFTWRHGDGSSQSTRDPGRPYERGVPMEAYVSHRYAEAGVSVRPSVEVAYAARFRVDGGPWRDVAGTVSIGGPAASLRVVEGRPTLVGAY